ncbi:MAG: ABC transporter permease [Gemmataceae bacterium]|nr:ABC transporter permease [Gemmataceae bacterium]
MGIVSQLLPAFLLTLVQFIAALPWLWAVDRTAFRQALRRPSSWGNVIGVLIGVTLVLAVIIYYQRGANLLELLGRVYAAVLHAQLIVDLFVLLFAVVLTIWPKGGAVALAAFREGIRQPMFWLIGLAAVVVFLVAIVLPYFTFGDDFKMMKQICFDVTMLSALVFGVLAASISIHEEIEGRTAVTLMSKPVTRRQFLIGKYLGILFAALCLTLFIGWFMNWALLVQPTLNPMDDAVDPLVAQAQGALLPYAVRLTTPDSFLLIKGASLWVGESIANGLGVLLGFGKVMVLVALASALATRMPLITNLLICVSIFALGHLAPVLRRVSTELRSQNPDNTALALVNFLTQTLETLTPSLEFFDMGPAIIRDTPIEFSAFAKYVVSAGAYGVVYTTIALLFGLILFEDRDLA